MFAIWVCRCNLSSFLLLLLLIWVKQNEKRPLLSLSRFSYIYYSFEVNMAHRFYVITDVLKALRSLKRLNFDLGFLNYCQINVAVSSFVKFKLHRNHWIRANFITLILFFLNIEISSKSRFIKKILASTKLYRSALKTESVPFINFLYFISLVTRNVDLYSKDLLSIHRRNLRNLRITTPINLILLFWNFPVAS